MRKVATVAALTAALATGCGSDGNSTTGLSDGGAATPPSERLSNEQFAAAERLYEATLPMDDLDESTDPEQLRAGVAEVVRTCDEVATTDDELLQALTSNCERLTAFADAAVAAEGCSAPDECAEQIVAAADGMDRIVSAAEDAVPTVEAAVAAGSCRDLLTSRRQMALFGEMTNGFRELGEAIGAGDDEAILAAATRTERAVARAERFPDAHETLAEFRRACAPASP